MSCRVCCASVLQFHTLNRSIHTHSINQVRKGIYSSGIGKWRKFAKQLEPIRQLLLPIMKRMKRNKDLPFPNEINWLLDPEFAYEEDLNRDRGAAKSPEKQPSSRAGMIQSTAHRESRRVNNAEARGRVVKSPPQKHAQSVSEVDTIEKEWRARHGNPPPNTMHKAQQVKQKRAHSTDDHPPAPSRMGGQGTDTRGKVGKVRGKRRIVVESTEESLVGKQGRESERRQRRTGKVKGKPKRKVLSSNPADAAIAKQTIPPRKRDSQRGRDGMYPSLERVLAGLESSLDADHVVTKALPAVIKALQYPSGDTTLDTLTAYGVCLFNMGNLKQAIEILEPLVNYRTDLYSALIALASSYAIDGNLRKAFTMIDLVTQNMDEDEWTFDICERRAQVSGHYRAHIRFHCF
jgi:hypothetical protein